MSSSDDPFTPLAAQRSAAFCRLGARDSEAPPPRDDATHAFDAGRAEARRELAAERRALARDVEAVRDAVVAWRAELRARYAELAVELAVETARLMVGEAVAAAPARWAPVVASAVARLTAADQVTLRVSPRVAALLDDEPAAVCGREPSVVGDAGCTDGACRVETTTGDDDRIAATRTAVAAALAASLAEGRG